MIPRAHPRSRGENSISGLIVDRATGSSPLTRGKRHNRVCNRVSVGLIPAHAGKTFSGSPSHVHSKAHPRSRGENGTTEYATACQLGSSPLTRGKLPPCGPSCPPRRLIPAHAGKTTAVTSPSRWRRAHPRSRGENEAARQPHGWETGSSPLTRGKPCAVLGVGSEGRLIPAHAGKTLRRPWGRLRGPAHPRSRGENDPAYRWVDADGGSSPLTRGKRYAGCVG